MKKLPLAERFAETLEEGVGTQGLSALRSEQAAPCHSRTRGSATRGDVQERKPSADTGPTVKTGRVGWGEGSL